jgi:arylsulfatase A
MIARTLIGVGLVMLLVAVSSDAAQSRPNILLILADDLGYADVGFQGCKDIPTPNLDKLAAEGLRFTDAHSPSTVCTPSRYSLLTGRMAFRTGYRGVFVGVGGPCLIEPGRLTLPQMLREQGYATACTGKWHVGLTFLDKTGRPVTRGGVEGVREVDFSRPIPDGPIHRGFDRFFGTACCPCTDWLYAYIDQDRVPIPPTAPLDKSRLPDHPYSKDCRPGLAAPGFDLEEVDLVFLRKSQEFLRQHVRSRPGQPFFLFHATQAVHLPSFAAPAFHGKTKAGPHGDFLFELDWIVGELLKTLDELGVADNTLVVFSSDNGPEVTTALHMRADYGHDGARPWRGFKRDNWEGGHRVPLLVRWPGQVKPGSRSDQTVCLTDIMATCAAVVGANLPADAAEDSVNLLPILRAEEATGPVRDYTLHQTIRLDLAIRRGPWKYLAHRGSGGNDYRVPPLDAWALATDLPNAPGQLYNLDTDPGETKNLYDQQPELVKELRSRLEAARQNGRSTDDRP